MDNVHFTVKIPPEAVGKRLSEYLAGIGMQVQAACGGRGTCGKCRVKVLSGSFYSDSSLSKQVVPDKDGTILSCKSICSNEEAVIQLAFTEENGLTDFLIDVNDFSLQEYYAVALDIGTTTLACGLIFVSSSGAKIVKTVTEHNPQASYGADVLSRISHAASGRLADLQNSLLETISQMLSCLTSGLPSDCYPDKMVVVGNTTMLHIFCGVSPEKIGIYPFTPEFTDMKRLKGSDVGLCIENIILFPSVSAFIGSDIVSGAFLTDLINHSEPLAIIDIGTNGEMILFTGKKCGSKLYAASAAAGPALEGAGISSGTGGIKGAVCKVDFIGYTPVCKTIGDAPALGICASGLVDLVAGLRTLNIIDDTGYMDCGSYVYSCAENGRNLAITQQDVRALQLAKSAIRAGFEALCDEAGISLCQVNKVYIAGGLGFYMNIRSALAIGMFDPDLRGKLVNVGNSAFGGAVKYLARSEADREVNTIADLCRTVDLNSSETFNCRFIDYMGF